MEKTVVWPDREMEPVREKRVDRGKKLARSPAAIIACVTARISENDKAIERRSELPLIVEFVSI